MKVHEFQARQLLAQAGIPVPEGTMVTTESEARRAAESVFGAGGRRVVVKAQVHAGGRGKAGFVRLVESADAAAEAARFMLSNRMVSPQTPPEGLEVRRLLVAEAVDIEREFYLAVTLDRARGVNTLIASAEGGVEIEHVAATRPEAIVRVPMHPVDGLAAFQARDAAMALGLRGALLHQAVDIMMRLSTLVRRSDASLIEINPLVVTPATAQFPQGRIMAADAKCTFDDNALFRQKKIAELFDPSEENVAELHAAEHGLSYVALDGNIGCLVNGAGLAMSTMDIIALHGGQPANFLDVGGSASESAVAEAFRIILADAKVKGVLVNIFGGIMQCDRIARAIVGAAETVGFRVPLVVRLEGTNVEEARRILQEAQSRIPMMQSAGDLTDAATRITRAVA